MKRREFITLLGGAAATWPLSLRAQQPATPLVGVMSPLSVSTAARNLSALRDGLRKLGYTEGRNITIESRFADGKAERFSALVADLVALKPAVILVGSTEVSPAVEMPRRFPVSVKIDGGVRIAPAATTKTLASQLRLERRFSHLILLHFHFIHVGATAAQPCSQRISLRCRRLEGSNQYDRAD